jgi:homoserine kinase type II
MHREAITSSIAPGYSERIYKETNQKPMAQYTKLLTNEIQEIAERYELQVFSYEPIEQGAGNSNYLLNTNHGKYILTVFEIEPNRVAYISKVLLLLEKHEYPVPRLPVMDNGEVLAKYQEKAVLVKKYIPGQVLEDLEEGQVNQVGTALAKLNEIPALDYLPDKHSYVEITYPKFMEQGIDRNYKNWVMQRYRYLIEKLPSQLPVGLVHGDIFIDNVLFEDGKFKAILDFEDVCRIYKIHDLGMAVVGICTEGTNIVIKKVKALVDGYQEVRLLEGIEKDSLQLCIEWAAIMTSTWRFCKYNIDTPDIEKSRKHMQMVDIAKNASEIPKEEFKRAIFA